MTRKFMVTSLLLGLWQVAERPTPPELAAISERGRALAAYDRATWHASDALVTADPQTGQGQRCIAALEGGRWRVVFGALNAEKSRFLASYEVVEREGRGEFRVVRLSPPREEAGFALAAARAIEAALADFGAPARPYNALALPAAGGLYVYLYPAQSRAGVYPLGGDVRYLFSPDGGTLVEKRLLHKTVAEPAGREKAGRHTHPLSDLPEDTDVLRALEQGAPETVTTPHFVYEVSADGTIAIRKEKKR